MITDAQIRELHAYHHPLMGSSRANIHVAAVILALVALGELSEGYPGARDAARKRCEQLYAELPAVPA